MFDECFTSTDQLLLLLCDSTYVYVDVEHFWNVDIVLSNSGSIVVPLSVEARRLSSLSRLSSCFNVDIAYCDAWTLFVSTKLFAKMWSGYEMNWGWTAKQLAC